MHGPPLTLTQNFKNPLDKISHVDVGRGNLGKNGVIPRHFDPGRLGPGGNNRNLPLGGERGHHRRGNVTDGTQEKHGWRHHALVGDVIDIAVVVIEFHSFDSGCVVAWCVSVMSERQL